MTSTRRGFSLACSTAAFPLFGFGNPPSVGTVDDLLHPWNDMRITMLAQLNHNPPSSHLLSDGSCRARTSEGIEDEITAIRS